MTISVEEDMVDFVDGPALQELAAQLPEEINEIIQIPMGKSGLSLRPSEPEQETVSCTEDGCGSPGSSASSSGASSGGSSSPSDSDCDSDASTIRNCCEGEYYTNNGCITITRSTPALVPAIPVPIEGENSETFEVGNASTTCSSTTTTTINSNSNGNSDKYYYIEPVREKPPTEHAQNHGVSPNSQNIDRISKTSSFCPVSVPREESGTNLASSTGESSGSGAAKVLPPTRQDYYQKNILTYTLELFFSELKEPTKSDTFPGTLKKSNTCDNTAEMHQRNDHSRILRSVLRKPGQVKKRRSVTFNEALNLFYDSECSCFLHDDQSGGEFRGEGGVDYDPSHPHHHQHHHHHHQNPARYGLEGGRDFSSFHPPIEFEDQPTLSPPGMFKDRFFMQDTDPGGWPMHHYTYDLNLLNAAAANAINNTNNSNNPNNRSSPPSPPRSARRKVFIKHEINGVSEESPIAESTKKQKSKIGGILKGGRLWRSNSAEGGKQQRPPIQHQDEVVEDDEPDVISQTEQHSSTNKNPSVLESPVTKVSIGTTPLRTSEQIRLALDSGRGARIKNKKQPECSSLVEKLRWLTSLEDDDPENQSGFNTWPSRDKNGVLINGGSGKKTDAGTSTEDNTFVHSNVRHQGINEARIKQISYTLEDIDEALKVSADELESFVAEDGGRIERLRKRYGDSEEDYGFSRRPSVKGIKPKFSSTSHIFAQFTSQQAQKADPQQQQYENQYENTRPPSSISTNNASISTSSNGGAGSTTSTASGDNNTSADFQSPPGSESSRAHFEMIRQSFEPQFNRPHSWSVSTLPHQHSTSGIMTPPTSQQQNNLQAPAQPGVPGGSPALSGTGSQQNFYGTLPSGGAINNGMNNQANQAQQALYGTIRRVPNVIGRPLYFNGALSVEDHPNKIVYRTVPPPETPSPTQQPPPIRYYGPPIRYSKGTPPAPPPRSTISSSSNSSTSGIGINSVSTTSQQTQITQMRDDPEGAIDDNSIKDSNSSSLSIPMNV